MFESTNIVIVDDNIVHLEALAKALYECGVASRRVHFSGELEDIMPCLHMRVAFLDLNLVGGTASDGFVNEFSTLGGLLDGSLRPSGPYFIVLWSMYPQQADDLQMFLNERLSEAAKPFAVYPLSKDEFLEGGRVKDPDKLVKKTRSLLEADPAVAALMGWEELVREAAGETLGTIVRLAGSSAEGGMLSPHVGRLLAHLADQAAGKGSERNDRFRAVSEALVPVLADRLSALDWVEEEKRSEVADRWNRALPKDDGGAKLKVGEAPALNRAMHFATPSDSDTGGVRGGVIALPEKIGEKQFESLFKLARNVAAHEQFFCKDAVENDENARWVLVQCRAACDNAQDQPGSVPFFLGVDMESAQLRNDGKPPAALWKSPTFNWGGEERQICVNARFQVQLTREEADNMKPLYRLRAQLLETLVYHIHSQAARPGMISFR